ncbi:hypothetical protein PybrP1_002169, partial [[Pythium] brassicae (nom. inval.)]
TERPTASPTRSQQSPLPNLRYKPRVSVKGNEVVRHPFNHAFDFLEFAQALSLRSAGEDGGGAAATPDAGATGSKEPKITVLRLELPTALKDEAVARLVEFLRGSPGAIEKDIATDLKKHFDQKHGQTWHCIVGKRFGCSVAYHALIIRVYSG